ncbi:MAG: hypothetical protein AAGI11_06940 [Pseudomonadota bacterium]
MAARLDQRRGAAKGIYQSLSRDLARSLAARDQPLEHDWAFGNLRVRIRIWGSDHSPYVDALEPWPEDSPVQPSFYINVVDAEACQIPWPGLTLEKNDFGRNRRLPRLSDARHVCFALRTEKGLAIADLAQGRAIVWLPSIESVAAHERAAPFRWLAEHIAGVYHQSLLHCAAIGLKDTAALILGPGGSGKSTLALTALGEGWRYYGDDYVLVSGAPTPRCWRIYRSAKWVAAGAKHPDWLDPSSGYAADGAGQKRMLFVPPGSPALAQQGSAVGLLARPRIDVDSVAPDVTPLAARDATMAAVMSTMAQTECPSAPVFPVMSAIARSVPSFDLRLGPGVQANLEALRPMLQAVR